MTFREKLERANPKVDSPTYRRMTGKITDKQYKQEVAEERRRIERSDRQAAEPR